MKKCKICNSGFMETHFNQKYCSVLCRHKAKRISQEKYKRTERGKVSNQKWVGSERRKQNEKSYQQKPIAMQKARLRRGIRYWRLKHDINEIIKRQESYQKYIAKNYDSVRERNRKARKIYSLTDKGKVARRNGKAIRRALEKIGSVTSDDWNNILIKHQFQCANIECGTKRGLEMDHIVPLSKGGKHSKENIQPLCRSCNAKKGAKIIEYFV